MTTMRGGGVTGLSDVSDVGGVGWGQGRVADGAAVVLAMGLLWPASPAFAQTAATSSAAAAAVSASATVVSVSPQGEIGTVLSQVRVRFGQAVVAAGDPRAAAPFGLLCEGLGASTAPSAPAGAGRWTSDREWVFDLTDPMPAGVRCEAALLPNWSPQTQRPQSAAGSAPAGATGNPAETAPAVGGTTRFRFSTGGPLVAQIRPWPGETVDENQHWVLLFNSPPLRDSVLKSTYCQVQGLGDRIAARWVDGADRDAAIAAQGWSRPGTRSAARLAERAVVLACERPLPADTSMRWVVGPGVASPRNPALLSRQPQTYGYKVRPTFTAEFSCERERAQAPCWPVRPLTLRFSAPVPRELAAKIRLLPDSPTSPASGPARPAVIDAAAAETTVQEIRFATPLPENARFRIELPADLRDDSGRALANANRFPLAVSTGDAPPIAKFAAAPFGIIERGLVERSAGLAGPAPAGILPITMRHVQADWAAPAAGGATPPGSAGSGAGSGAGNPNAGGNVKPAAGVVRVMRLDEPADILAWLGHLQRHHERELSAREAGRPRSEWTITEKIADAQGREQTVVRENYVGTREVSLLRSDSPVATGRIEPPPPPTRGAAAVASPRPIAPPALRTVQNLALPPLPTRETAGSSGAEPRPFEVIGLPLAEPGYHVVEVESARLGASLLDRPAPMFVRTGVLVTNLGVHIKHGRENTVVWVTSLDRGRPVRDAEVRVHDCRGQELWRGKTDAEGLARIDRSLDPRPAPSAAQAKAAGGEAPPCIADEGLFVVARAAGTGSGSPSAALDQAFAFSSWQRGIEPWRFDLPTSDSREPDRRAHTVFDRTLLRAGETVSMKHFLRVETRHGLALAPMESLPDTVVLEHIGSGRETTVPIRWQGNRSATSSWVIPPSATLGAYTVWLERRARRAGVGPSAGAGTGAAEESTPTERIRSGDFRVEAFRVPLIQASLAPVGVLPVSPRELPLAVQIGYLSGGGVEQRDATVSALLQPRSVGFAGYEDFRFDAPREVAPGGVVRPATTTDDEDEAASPRARPVADRLAAPTNREGAGKVTIGPLPAITRPSELLAELTVTDPNGEIQTRSLRLPLWPSDRVIGVQVPNWANQDRPVPVQVVALDTEGRPQANQAITVSARVTQSFSVRKRIVGGFYAYDNRVEVKDLGEVCRGSTDAKGRLVCDARLATSGEVELVASTSDTGGRASRGAARVWMQGSADAWFAQDDDDRIEIRAEKSRLNPGETARLQVRMPYREATLLVSVEREGVITTRVQRLRADNPVIELPIERDWAPNVVVSVIALRGRIRDVPWTSFFAWGWKEPLAWWRAWRDEGPDHRPPTALVDLAKPSFKLGAVGLEIGTDAQRLQVSVKPDREVYKIRETAQVRVKVTQGGQSLAAGQSVELAFAAVDEGLLALRPNASWDLLAGLIQPRPWGVSTATGHSEIIGRRHYGRKAVAPGGGGGRGATRELFDTLLVWRDRVTLDERGEAVVAVPLNDSLTSFRLVAVADSIGGPPASPSGTADGSRPATRMAFGHGQAVIRVTQDLQVLPGLPLAVREGDRFDALVTVRNTTTRALALVVRLAPDALSAGAGLAGPPPQTVDLPAGSARELSFAVAVPDGLTAGVSAAVSAGVTVGAVATSKVGAATTTNTAAIDWTVTAEEATTGTSAAARLSDRVQRRQAVVPAVPVRVWQARTWQLPAGSGARGAGGSGGAGAGAEAGASDPPVLWSAPAGALTNPAAGGNVARGGLQIGLQARLADDLPSVRRWFEAYPFNCLEQQASRAIGLDDRSRWAQLLTAWPSYLDRDGLANYFPPRSEQTGGGSDRLTAYLVSAAHAAGFELPPQLLDPMLAGLVAYVEGRLDREPSAFGSGGAALDRDVRRLAALDALSRHGRVEPRHLGVVRVAPAQWPTAALIDWIQVLQRVQNLPQRAERLQEAWQQLRSRLVAGGSTLRFVQEAQDDWWWLMDNADSNAARLILAALDDPAWRDEMPRLVAGHLARQRQGAWSTTTANLWSVVALRRFSARFESVPVTGRTTARWEAGGSAAPGAVDWAQVASAAAASVPGAVNQPRPSIDLPWSAAASAAPAVLRISHEGTGQPWVTVQALAAVPLVAPVRAGYAIRRTVTVVQQRQAGQLSRGDVLRVQLEIDAVEGRTWVVVADPLPAGASVLGSGLGGDSEIAQVASNATAAGRSNDGPSTIWPTHVERTPDQWRAYIGALPRGRHLLSYTVRLSNAGRFALPPTRVEAMYAPDSFGEVPNAVVEVKP